MISEAAVEALSAIVRATAHEHHCPTIVWAVTVDGAVVTAGHGGENIAGRIPTVDTVYRIASMTKSFTAAAVLALRDEGSLRLDDLVSVHLPLAAAIVGPTSDAAPITVRHLLSMASGLASDDPWADRHLDITEPDLDAIVAAGGTFAVPTATGFEYSNLGFAMLGRVVHNATGATVQDHVRRRFLEPLGMTRTGWHLPDHDDWARPFNLVDGVAVPDDLPPLGDGAVAPMGGLWSSAADIGRWMGWLNDANHVRDGDDDGPLRRASRREMQQLHRYSGMKPLAGRSAPTGYGFGLMVRHDEILGHVVAHSGGLPGYGSNMRWCAGTGLGVVALANVMYAPMSELTLRMLDVLHEHGAIPAASTPDSSLLEHMGRRLLDVLDVLDVRDGPGDTRADMLFADNVALDEPFARRSAAAAALPGTGTWTIDGCTATTTTMGDLHISRDDGAGQRVRGRLELMLTPTVPPRIQSCEVTLDVVENVPG